MRAHQFIVTSFLLAVLVTPSFARDYLRSPLPNKIYLASKIDGQPFYGLVGEKGKKSRWYIAQWGIRFEFPAVIDCLGSCTDRTWQVRNADDSGRIKFTHTGPTGNVADLTQDTFGSRLIGCDPTQEFDLLLLPTNTTHAVDNYPGSPEGWVKPSRRPTLGAVTNLHIQVRQEVVSATQGTRCNAPYNLASTLIGVVFLNQVTGHTLFYQIVSYDSRNASFNGSWFMTEAPYFGVNDDMAVYNRPLLVSGAPSVWYDIDIAERVKFLIRTSPYLPGDTIGPHKDLKNWQLAQVYFGSLINGEAALTSRHSEIRLYSE
ncbi:MAG: hypothetical protein EXR78_02380 [Deltaproteobacteria bacterium]|nr:hypothetical protein [Deltaproteobacteria bacterium]